MSSRLLEVGVGVLVLLVLAYTELVITEPGKEDLRAPKIFGAVEILEPEVSILG